MRLGPVVPDVAFVVKTVEGALGEPVSLHGELDVDVYRVRRATKPSDLVVRVFGEDVGREALDTTVGVLARLEDTPFPAERCSTPTPVVPAGQGRHLLVTEYVEPVPAPSRGFVLAWCAGLLGRLGAHAGQSLPPGGGWHRLGQTPTEEIDQALRLGGELGGPVQESLEALAAADDATGLPEAVIHPDLTPPNLVPQGDGPPVVIDWVGVGRGARIWPLAFLMFATGPQGAQRIADRYLRSVTLTEDEWRRLPGVMIARPLTLDLWAAAHERLTVRQVTTRTRQHRHRIEAVVAALGRNRG
jgi:Ser/Thr protein kinase RdoA (MazF antagonist)